MLTKSIYLGKNIFKDGVKNHKLELKLVIKMQEMKAQMIIENKGFCTSSAFLWYQCHRFYSVTDSTFATFGTYFLPIMKFIFTNRCYIGTYGWKLQCDKQTLYILLSCQQNKGVTDSTEF